MNERTKTILQNLVTSITEFEEDCEAVEYTDTDEAWALLNMIRDCLITATLEN